MFRFNKVLAAAVASAAVFASPAQASFTFTQLNQATTINYSAAYAGATLGATVTYQLTGWSGKEATFLVTATNTTALSEVGVNRVTAFGIDVITPTLKSVTDSSSAWGTKDDVTFPGFHKVAFCAFAGNNCSGGSNDGLLETDSLSFVATFQFSQNVVGTSITFGDPFTIKYQSAGSTGRSIEFSGCRSGDTSCVVSPPQEEAIPEPATLALAGLALLGAISTRRRSA